MKRLYNRNGRRLTRTAFGVALCVSVIALTLAVNLLLSSVASAHLWFADLSTYSRVVNKTTTTGQKVTITTDYEMYNLSEGVIELLDNTLAELSAKRQGEGEEPVQVELIFCDDPDVWMASELQRLVYLTALQLQKQFPDMITVRSIDIYKNPSAVQKYQSNTYTNIYATNVIVASGTEFRRLSLREFFTFDSTTDTVPWAYSGEKRFAATILAVTQAESPVCVLLTNHGEQTYSPALLSLLDNAGYTVVEGFDLARDPIPENCRLMLSLDPQTDFSGYLEVSAGTATVSEIAKLDAYLDENNSFMIFMDPDTPTLPNLEEYLQKWGVEVCRAEDTVGVRENYLVKDTEASLSADGQTLIADYVTTGLGGAMTEDMRSITYPAKVVFKNATALRQSSLYQTQYVEADDDNGTPAYSYGSYSGEGAYRTTFSMFTASPTAQPWAFGQTVEQDEHAAPLSLMTITSETTTESGDVDGYTSVSHSAYVVACSSTELLRDELLLSNTYGNADLLSGVLRALGNESHAARFEQYIKPLRKYDVDTSLSPVSSQYKTAVTTVLVLLPGLVCCVTGLVVLTRRKHA